MAHASIPWEHIQGKSLPAKGQDSLSRQEYWAICLRVHLENLEESVSGVRSHKLQVIVKALMR